MRDKNTKTAFIEFLKDPVNKDLRFWQAVRNFSKYAFIYGGDNAGDYVDTFHIESDKETNRFKR